MAVSSSRHRRVTVEDRSTCNLQLETRPRYSYTAPLREGQKCLHMPTRYTLPTLQDLAASTGGVRLSTLA